MITAQIKQFRAKLASGTVLGPFSKSTDPAFIEVMGHAGFDFVVLDLEHGPNSILSLQNLIRAAQVSNIFPVVRVKEDATSLIGEVLDVGAGGVQVPKIRCRKDVEKVMEAARFAPKGARGVCRFVRAADYSSLDRFTYFAEANTALIILQIEGTEALQNMEDILSVEGVDIIFIGPYDLSQSLGIPGQVSNPRVTEAMRRIVDQCVRRKVLVGTFVDTIADARKWKDAGVRYLGYSVDVGLFTDKCREVVAALAP